MGPLSMRRSFGNSAISCSSCDTHPRQPPLSNSRACVSNISPIASSRPVSGARDAATHDPGALLLEEAAQVLVPCEVLLAEVVL